MKMKSRQKQSERARERNESEQNWQKAHILSFCMYFARLQYAFSVLLLLFVIFFCCVAFFILSLFLARCASLVAVYRYYKTVHVYQIVCTIYMYMTLSRCVDNLALFSNNACRHHDTCSPFFVFLLFFPYIIQRYHFFVRFELLCRFSKPFRSVNVFV